MKKIFDILKLIAIVGWIGFLGFELYRFINANFHKSVQTFKGYEYLGEFIVTAYESSELSCGDSTDGKTSMNLKVAKGIVASDPRIIKHGEYIYIKDLSVSQNSSGYYLVADKGGAIKNQRLDIFFPTVKECLNFGKRELKVYRVKINE